MKVLPWVDCLMCDVAWNAIEEREKASGLRTPTKKEQKALSHLLVGKEHRLKAGLGRPLHCRQNAEQFIQENPTAKMVFGEIVWIHKKKRNIIAKEAHVVVELNGILHDVTSYFGGDIEILFLVK